MRYSIQPKDKIFVKGYGFLPFARKMKKRYISGKISTKI